MTRAARPSARRPWNVLLIHPDAVEARLTAAALQESGATHVLTVMPDGPQTLALLRRRGDAAAAGMPDLILLDLSRSPTDGSALLAEIKGDGALRHIPVVVLSDSQAERDVMTCYRLHANCYLRKPAGGPALASLLRGVASYWLSGDVVLPARSSAAPA